MLKHRLSKFCSTTFVALSLLFTGSFVMSCQDAFDEYSYDDEEPGWLGSSIYAFLQEETEKGGEHTYRNFMSLIDRLDMKEVLSRTGSKTLFVADDAAFERFYAKNRWGVTCFEDLTEVQMKLLFRSAMLDNAYLLDMLSNASTTKEDGTTAEGACLRRETSNTIVDSVPFFKPEELPQHNKYWDRFRTREGIRIALDGTKPMMVHFLNDFLRNNQITNEDMQIIFNGRTRKDDEAFIFQDKVLASGIVYEGYSDDTMTVICKNGYVYRLEDVLVAPSNMAEELRRNPDTKIFSRILDRFSVPVHDGRVEGGVDDMYNTIYNYGNEPDSVFMLRYLNESTTHTLVGVNERNLPITSMEENKTYSFLPFDPGWNMYQDGGTAAEADMAAMFVPKDEYMYKFFAPGGSGYSLVQRYAPDVEITDDIYSIIPALDSIPNDIIVAFAENLMNRSFVASVPSKFDKIQDDSFEELGVKPSDVDSCIVANNGVIYILNNVFGPAKYRSVSAPPLILSNMSIMLHLITKMKYDSYLLAMDAEYSFIVPDNDYFVYYDPSTLKKDVSTMYTYHYDKKYKGATASSQAKMWHKKSTFNVKNNDYVIVKDSVGEGDGISDAIARELLDNLIILGAIEDSVTKNQYHLTKGYSTIKCVKENGSITFYGGEQLELGRKVDTKDSYGQDNGVTYCTYSSDETNPSGIPTPATKSLYARVNGVANFSEFYKLCAGPAGGMSAFISKIYPSVTNEDDLNDSIRAYSIFASAASAAEVPLDYAVPFFSTYHYSVYIPTNDAVKNLYKQGLPSWNDALVEANAGNLERATLMMRQINNYVRYHFQDNSVFVDKEPFSFETAGVVSNYANFETASTDLRSGRFLELRVESATNPQNGLTTVSLRDDSGNTSYVLNETGKEGITWNIMARDLLLNSSDLTAENATGISTSSFVAIHQIDRALMSNSYLGYDGRFLRYAPDGELVDTMTVANAPANAGNVTIDEVNKYLIADCGEIEQVDANGNATTKRIGYLMQPIKDATSAYAREEYVLDSNDEKILITEDGYIIKELVDESDEKYYDFVDKDGNVGTPVKVDNNGSVIE